MRENSHPLDFISIDLNFTAKTTSLQTQNNIESKLEKKSKKIRGAKGTSSTVIFIDDVNLPQVEKFGAKPVIELLRHFIEKGGFYDR